MRQYKFILVAALGMLPATANLAKGHGTPINVFVESPGNQLAVFAGFDPAILESLGGSDIFTDEPGIGVSSPVNGLTEGDALMLRVVQGLLYWDGSEVAPTTRSISIDWPDAGGTSPVENYTVTAQSGYQTGMLWGNYQPEGGTGGWDAHGDFSLGSASVEPGIYGLVLQLASQSKVSSEPFLLPLVYDPASLWGFAEVMAGRAALEQAVMPLPTADFDRDTVVGGSDLFQWQKQFGLATGAPQVWGDADGDADVDGGDFLAWQRQFAPPGGNLLAPSGKAIPEPAAVFLLLAWGIFHALFYQRTVYYTIST